MNLNTQTKNINMVIMSNKIDKQLIKDIETYLKENCNIYAFILHDKDTTEDGEIKKKHLHLVYEKHIKTRLITELNLFNKKFAINVNAISIEKNNNLCGSLQYLIHKNAPNKYQYLTREILTNIDKNELESYLQMENKTISLTYLMSILEVCETAYDIISYIGLNQYRMWRTIIQDIALSRDMYIKGLTGR